MFGLRRDDTRIWILAAISLWRIFYCPFYNFVVLIERRLGLSFRGVVSGLLRHKCDYFSLLQSVFTDLAVLTAILASAVHDGSSGSQQSLFSGNK